MASVYVLQRANLQPRQLLYGYVLDMCRVLDLFTLSKSVIKAESICKRDMNVS